MLVLVHEKNHCLHVVPAEFIDGEVGNSDVVVGQREVVQAVHVDLLLRSLAKDVQFLVEDG